MGLSSTDMLKFTKEEKKEIIEALNNILDDINSLWKLSNLEEITHYFKLKGNDWGIDSWSFIIDKEGIRIKDYPQEIILESFKPVRRRPKVKNYTEIYYFLRQYEKIRNAVEDEVIRSRKEKSNGIEEIINLKNKYAKEATIEVDLPETINPHSIDVRQEDGKTIGEIKMGYGSIKIITKGPIILARHEEEQAKVKRK